MKNILLGAAATAAVLAGAPAAIAATYVNVGPVVDGAFTLTYGNTGIMTPTFNDTFDFNAFSIPWLTGEANFTISSTMSTASQNITFTEVSFNDQDFTTPFQGWNEYRVLNNVQVTFASDKTLRVSGLAGTAAAGANASYSGVITFAPAQVGVVPEPGAWALMILGFGGAGAMLRRRNTRLVPAVA